MTYSKDVPGFVANGLLMPFINEVRGVTHTVSRGRHAYRKAHCECTGNHDAREGNSRTGIWRDDRLNLLDSFQGIATREDIDKTLKLGMNHPMGPLQLGLFSAASSSPCSCEINAPFVTADL